MSGLSKTYCCLSVFLVLMSGGCATLPDNSGMVESHAFTDTSDTRMGNYLSGQRATNPGKSGFFLLGSGLDAFLARAILAEGAERSIDAQYYMIHSDLVGRLFIDQLLKAADRRVRVRLLVDDIDVLAIGNVAKEVSASFDLYWNYTNWT